jgi:hypothetical protein
LYDSLKPALPAQYKDNFLVNFALGWAVTTGAGLGKFTFLSPIEKIFVLKGRLRLVLQCGLVKLTLIIFSFLPH